MERNFRIVKRLEYRYKGCGKVCKSIAGLTMHVK